MRGKLYKELNAVNRSSRLRKPHRTIECLLFFGCQSARRAFLKLTQCERPNGHPHQPQHFQVEMFEQAANLAVLSLVENNLQPRIAFAAPKMARVLHAKKPAIVRANALTQIHERG